MKNVKVNPDLIKWAIRRSGKSEDSLKKSFKKLDEWIECKSYPTLKQLKAFAKSTYVPFGYMFLSNPPLETIDLPYYRSFKKDGEMSANLIDTIYAMQSRQQWMREYLISQSAEKIKFISSIKTSYSTEMAAHIIRNTLGLDILWSSKCSNWTEALKYLERFIENKGILVAKNSVVGSNPYRPLNVGEFRGFTLIDEYAPLIFINSRDSKAAQMFTLAHEIAHLFIGESAVFDLRKLMPADNTIEQFCDKVAAEFLVPKEKFIDEMKKVITKIDRFTRLAQKFKVSEIVVARRALDLELINKKDFFEFYDDYINKFLENKEKDKKKSGGPDYYKTLDIRLGSRFSKAVIGASLEGNILYSDAYRLLGVSAKTFDKLVDIYNPNKAVIEV